jgi:hypothetical protein
MKLQSEHLQVQSLDWEPVLYEKAGLAPKSPNPTKVQAGVSHVVSEIQESLPAEISANKRAMVERLMTLWAEGALKR